MTRMRGWLWLIATSQASFVVEVSVSYSHRPDVAQGQLPNRSSLRGSPISITEHRKWLQRQTLCAGMNSRMVPASREHHDNNTIKSISLHFYAMQGFESRLLHAEAVDPALQIASLRSE